MDDEKQKELEFAVMPREYRQSLQAESANIPEVSGERRAKIFKLGIIFLILLVLLGGTGYLTYSKFFKDRDAQNQVPVNPIQVPELKTAETDTDKDGLTDTEEQKRATNPRLSDTDGDGLADGDEVNIYKTDPLLSDTDGDSFDDGREVARGYSPLINVSQKASAQEVQFWTDSMNFFKLHEPTPTTLKIEAAVSVTQSKVTYTNSVYKYSFELPAVLTFRETDESRLVGIYISGTNPEGEVLEDPMNIGLAVKVGGQTLKEWVGSQYQAQDYEFLQERTINGISAIRLVGVRSETCPMNKTFYPKDNSIIILTWTCNQNSPFADLYEQIAQSFKFIK